MAVWSSRNGGFWQVGVSIWILSETDTTATLRVQTYFRSDWRIELYSGIFWTLWQDGYKRVDTSGEAEGRWIMSDNDDLVVLSTYDYTVNKATTPKTYNGGATCYVNIVSPGSKNADDYVTVPAITVYAPYAVTSVTNTRNSDTKNTVKWTNHTDVTHPYHSIKVERRMDGGSWSQIASLSAGATSYVDSAAQANHSYQYRVRPCNSTGYGSYAASNTTYNTPAAPTKLVASRKAETAVSVAVTNPAKTATALEVQRSTNGTSWTTIKTVSGHVTSFEDTPGGGTFYYRARNTRGSMASAWSPASAGVVTICAPNAPSLLEPASGIVFDYGGGNITFGWAHNPKDGSAQTAAEVAYSVDGGATWTTQTVATAKTCTIANDFALNDVVTWKVRTKGSHADFSPYSNTRIFAVYQQPTVLFEEPADGFTVENVPIHCKVGYSDASGGMANLTVYAVEGDYDPSKPKLFEMNMGTVQEFDVPASMFTPENGKTYTLVAVTRSSSTMQGIATRSIAVDFVEPMHGALDVENDAEAGTTSILAKLVMDEAKEIAVSMNVYRVHDGKRVLLGENIGNGASLVDLYAPLNVDYAYEVVTFAASGAFAVVTRPARFDSKRVFFMWGGKAVSMEYDPAGDFSIKRPNKVRVSYAGRPYPVSYDSRNIEHAENISGVVFDREEAFLFRDMMDDGGRCVYKSYDGDVYKADVELNVTPRYTASEIWGDVKASLTRIDGGDL